ncbi:MAG TPA: putative virulence factor [Pseudomonas sp.]|uniref:putative virulence factor n=1 Tax=Pseudomonas sp. TaxID=306 RepID=UPI002ED8A697
MSDLTPQQTELSANWAAVHEGAGQALQWISQTRGNAPRLDGEADNLNLRLHRARNLASSLGRVACTPMTIGFFGLSQAGKSYLISALAAGDNGKLETRFGDKTLDFIAHINPVGGGKEATGLVTRFSRGALPSPDPAFPVELKLFSEIEIAKILANAWFKDFDLEHIDYDIDEARIQRILKAVEGRESSVEVPGVSADDVVSLWDYLNDNFKGSVKKLQHLYWPHALRLAPRLSIQQRGELFSILWGEQPALTRVYEKLSSALAKLGHASTVFAPLSALVSPDGNGQYSQTDSIMNVDILNRFDTSADLSIDVRPQRDGQLGASASITVAQLAALTTEMTFCLINEPQDKVVNEVDLLDFPGYRGRMKLRELKDSSGADGNMVSQLLLRGKVAYLFERYTDCQEMNALVVCTASDKQSDVSDVGPVLTRWIEKTQGIDAQDRAKRSGIGLIWALTMLDKRISGALSTPENMLDAAWEGMIKLTMIERFGTFNWMTDWAGKPFHNTYLVRKPRMETPFIELEDGDELRILERSQGRIDLLGQTFAANELVIKHVNQPAQAWSALLQINDGGIKRFSQSFNGVANTEFKLSRIREQLSECLDDLTTHGLSSWYQSDGDGAMAAKRAQAQLILQQVGKNQAIAGELIDHLQLPSDGVRDLYLSGIYEDDSAPAADDVADEPQPTSLYGNSGGFDFADFGAEPSADDSAAPSPQASAAAPELQGSDHRFAKAVFNAWIAHLRDLANRQNLLNLLGLSKPVIEAVADELITAGYRQDLPGQLAKAVLKRAQSGARRDQLVERQVLEVQLVLRDFVSWFGFIQTPLAQRPKSLVGSKDHLFAFYRDVEHGQVPILPPQPANQAKLFFGDWLSGLAALTLANAGHSAGREITSEQNERLGHVLAALKAR